MQPTILSASPTSSQRVALVPPRKLQRRLLGALLILRHFHSLWTLGRVDGTRELTFVSLPFVAIYQDRSGFAGIRSSIG